MKKNTSILLSLVLIFAASYFFYYKGESALKKAKENFQVVAFENTDLKCNKESLSFFIENNLAIPTEFDISIEKNQEFIEKLQLNLEPEGHQLIFPEKNKIETLCSSENNFKYQIKVKSKTQTKNIYKIIEIQ